MWALLSTQREAAFASIAGPLTSRLLGCCRSSDFQPVQSSAEENDVVEATIDVALSDVGSSCANSTNHAGRPGRNMHLPQSLDDDDDDFDLGLVRLPPVPRRYQPAHDGEGDSRGAKVTGEGDSLCTSEAAATSTSAAAHNLEKVVRNRPDAAGGRRLAAGEGKGLHAAGPRIEAGGEAASWACGMDLDEGTHC